MARPINLKKFEKHVVVFRGLKLGGRLYDARKQLAREKNLAGVVTAKWVLYSALGIAGFAAVGSIVYSYVVWKRERDTAHAGT